MQVEQDINSSCILNNDSIVDMEIIILPENANEEQLVQIENISFDEQPAPSAPSEELNLIVNYPGKIFVV